MKELEQRIQKDGQIIMPDILKVDSFLNQQIDIHLFEKIGEEFYRLFKDKNINKILTIESSGIAVAAITARYFNNVPVVFIKKNKTKLVSDVYQTKVHSFTKNIDYIATVSKDYLTSEDHILFIDDFLANGEAALGAIELCNQAHAHVEGIGIVIEKSFQSGHQKLENLGYKVEALAKISHFKDNQVYFKEG